MNLSRVPRALAGLRRAKPRRSPLRLSLALQGGGAHGAFTWGVLDRLLEEPAFELAAVSGTSAGAVNAVALASGWSRDGPAGARELLGRLWRAIGQAARGASLDLGGFSAFALDLAMHLFSPYQLNPLRIDPLRELLEDLVDFPKLRRECPMPLLLAATHVRTGNGRIFREHELTPETVLASACLPQIHHAVEVDCELYWDGGYSSNPPVVALAELGRAERMLVVRINPSEVADPPHRAAAIRHRTAQIVFGRPLADELAQLDTIRRLAARPVVWLQPRLARLARLDVQVIDGDETLASLDPATALAPETRLLEDLREQGRAAAARWLRRQDGATAEG